MNRVKVFSMCAYVGFAHLGMSKFGYDYMCVCENAKRLRSTLKRNLKEKKKNTHTHTQNNNNKQTKKGLQIKKLMRLN